MSKWVLLGLSLGLPLCCVSASWAGVSIVGTWQQGAVLQGHVDPGTKVEFLGHQVKVAVDGHFVIGLGRDVKKQVVVKTTAADGSVKEQLFQVKQRDYKIQRVEGVPARTVNPDPKHLERISKEAALARKARADVSDRQDYRDDFQWPLTGPISGVYGSQRYYRCRAAPTMELMWRVLLARLWLRR